MKVKFWLLLAIALLALIGLYEEPQARPRSSPYWQPMRNFYADSLGDTLFAGQSDTTEAIEVDDCVGVAVCAQGTGSDSVLLTVQASVDGNNWQAFGTAIALQNWASGYPILSRALTTVDVASSPTSQGSAAVSRYVRVIVKNNCDSGANLDRDTLTTVTVGVTCGK